MVTAKEIGNERLQNVVDTHPELFKTELTHPT
jgi:hypothetical protein